MRYAFKAKARDALDAVYLRAMERDDLPPWTLRCHVGPAREYEQTPAEYIAYFKLLTGVQMHEAILDIACGTGRFAAQLIRRPHFFHGTYRGFDIDRRSVEWARANLRSGQADLRFDHVDLFNEHYNPHATALADEFRFPYDDCSFDFAFAMSLFTHLSPRVTANYLRQLRRVLRPGGRALLSFVLLDPGVEFLGEPAFTRLYNGVLVDNGLSSAHPAGKVFDLGGYATLTPETPAIVTFYGEADLRNLAKEAELEVDAVYPGTWRDADAGPAFQDLVVVHRSAD
jgi:SAM-dependent methyltransferase